MFKKKIKLPIYNNETKIIMNALNEFRNKLIQEGKETEYVDEVLLRAIDAPPKKKVLTRCLRRDEYRY